MSKGLLYRHRSPGAQAWSATVAQLTRPLHYGWSEERLLLPSQESPPDDPTGFERLSAFNQLAELRWHRLGGQPVLLYLTEQEQSPEGNWELSAERFFTRPGRRLLAGKSGSRGRSEVRYPARLDYDLTLTAEERLCLKVLVYLDERRFPRLERACSTQSYLADDPEQYLKELEVHPLCAP